MRPIDTTKFIPIIRANASKQVPKFLGPRLYIDFENEADYGTNLVRLAREIHGAPAIPKPPLGSNPFSEKAENVGTAPIGALRQSEYRLSSDWFSREHDRATTGLKKLNFLGHMELRSSIRAPVSKTQIELLNAVRQSEVKTFGWPIGITLENRDEYRPRPYGDGIRAEVAIGGPEGSRTSYDYWALRANADFYLLQSLFEDSRIPNRIFFDTRIIRVTESLMFLQSLYTKLGAPLDSEVNVQITHRGLTDRMLTSASNRRFVHERETKADGSRSEITTVLGKMHDSRVENVHDLLAPMFMLFDFMQFNTSIYEDIVRAFERGEVR